MLDQCHQELAFPNEHGLRLLNCLQIGVGLFCSENKWGITSMVSCDCGAKEQIAELIITLVIHHHSNGTQALPQM